MRWRRHAFLRDDGMRWAAEGTISLEEVVRVTRE
jgi:type II secretory ATPase GspE/PulE/Tfp pilus assembly ATPase PilB-like protein